MHTHDERRLAARTPIYDHAGMELGRYEPARIRELMKRSDIHVSGSKKCIRSLHFLGPDPAHLLQSGSRWRRPAGTPHRRENYYNIAGVWHIDRIPDGWRVHFTLQELYA